MTTTYDDIDDVRATEQDLVTIKIPQPSSQEAGRPSSQIDKEGKRDGNWEGKGYDCGQRACPRASLTGRALKETSC